MLAWLVDNAATLYVLLGILVLCLAALWWMNRKPYYLIALGAVGVLIGLLIVVSLFFVTDRQRIRSTIMEMRDGVLAGKPERVFKHFAKDFRLEFSDPKTFMERAAQSIRRHHVEDIVLWDFDFEVPPDRAATARVAFRARVSGQGGEGLFLVRTDFVFEDGQWRMRTIHLFNGFVNTDQPIPIPIP